MNFQNKKVAVLGLGLEGRDVINYLLNTGAIVSLCDRKPENDLNFDQIPKDKITIITGEAYLDNLFDYDYIIRSPGIYRYLPELVEAEKRGVIITSAVNILFEASPAKIIGVTGTKGKGTTCTLIYDILKADKRDVYLAGNIGKPYLELLTKLNKESIVVMEMSSFQLIDLDKSPNIGVVLNITSDHMDWHKDVEEYVNAKKNIVSHQTENDFAVINEEYESSRSFANETKGKVVYFSKIKLDPVYKVDPLLRGEHNFENIAAAVSIARIVGVSEETIVNTVKNFKGLEHRLEFIGEYKGIKFYNDSFATGPQPTMAAVNSFTEPETLILGGSDKGLEYSELASVISKKDNVKNIILIGQIRLQILEAFKETKFNGRLHDLGISSMEEIIKKAIEITPKNGVVILSPAAASFDMFKDYKDRGNQFKSQVGKLSL